MAEMVINSHPVTYVSPDDLQEPLTPAHFLTGKRILSLPDGICCGDDPDDDVDLTHDHLTRRMKYLNIVLNTLAVSAGIKRITSTAAR